MKLTNILERLNDVIGRRTYVVRIFPHPESCRRLVRALAVETHENRMKANLNERTQGAQTTRLMTRHRPRLTHRTKKDVRYLLSPGSPDSRSP